MKTFLALLLFNLTLEASGQTIADVARMERARQKEAQSRGKGTTYTSATMPFPSHAPPAEPAPAEKSPEANTPGAAQPSAEPTAPPVRDEKYWRTLFEAARRDLKRAEDNVGVLETKINELNMQLLRQSDIYN